MTVVAQPGVDLGVGLHLLAGIGLGAPIGIERRLMGEIAGDAEARPQPRQIVGRGKEIVADARRIARIGRAQQNLAAAVGMQQRRPDAEAVAKRRRAPAGTTDADAARCRGT